MSGNITENNVVSLSGRIVSGLQFSHEVYGEGFYSFKIDVPRLSDSYDKIVITVSERLMDKQLLEIGKMIEVDGQFRSYNSYSGEGSKLILTVFAREILFIDDLNMKNPNQIYLNGYICKRPVYRTTPFGREIADMLLAVNRAYNKSDYIPCICWGRNARYAENLTNGDNVKIWGRIQSREYQKKFDNGTVISKIAYEVSVSKMEIVQKGSTENNLEDEQNESESVCD